MKSRWVEHRGKRVFIADFTNFGAHAEALKAECAEIVAVLRNEPEDSVLAISDINGTAATPQTLQAIKGLVTETNRYVQKRAVIGVGRYQKYFLDAFAIFTGDVTFVRHETLQQALDWITRAARSS